MNPNLSPGAGFRFVGGHLWSADNSAEGRGGKVDQDTQTRDSTAGTLASAATPRDPAEKWQVQWVPLDSVQLNPENPRHN